MGAKFCNLNIRVPENALALILPGLVTRQFVPGWLTAAGAKLQWGETQKAAKELSKGLDTAVLSTEYFDDDYAEFAVYVGGKRAARFVPQEYEGFRRVPGKPAQWREALGLPQSSEKALKTVFRERDPETALRLLECAIGCPLWADAEEFDRTVPPDANALAEYLVPKMPPEKIRNRTRAALLDEIPWRALKLYGDVALGDRDGEGKRPVIAPENGCLRELFRTDRAEEVQTLCRDPERGNVFLRVSGFGGRGLVFSREGALLDEFSIPRNSPCECLFLDGERLFVNGICRSFRARTDEWQPERRAGFECFSNPLVLPGHRLFFFRQMLDGGGTSARYSLNVIGLDGGGHVERILPSGGFCRDAVQMGEGILLRMSSPDCLALMDFDLKERWSLPLEDWDDPIHMDAGTGICYLRTEREVLALDLASRRYTASRSVGRGEHLWVRGLLPGTGPLVSVGVSTVEVWDGALKTVSRHRLKGVVSHVTPTGRILTLSAPDHDTPGTLRLYGLTV